MTQAKNVHLRHRLPVDDQVDMKIVTEDGRVYEFRMGEALAMVALIELRMAIRGEDLVTEP